ncbi:MAG: sugar transferase [Bacteroidota bacterium]|nr:sugar transferase [Bacteroidota bacterium]
MRGTSIESAIYHPKKWNDNWQVSLRNYIDNKRTYFIFKRCVDLVVSTAVMAVIFPVFFPFIMLLISMDSRGPVFFKQKRVGFLGRTFWCYKFRTMYVNDEADTHQAIRNDPRVTPIGRLLRQTGLDELPQFVNVFLGHMSIVGPRPHMLKDSRDFSSVIANYKFRNLVRPGITGMSQIRGCRGPASTFQSIFRRYQWDAYYVRSVGFAVDMRIMAETVWLMIRSLFLGDRADEIGSSQVSADRIGNKKIA